MLLLVVTILILDQEYRHYLYMVMGHANGTLISQHKQLLSCNVASVTLLHEYWFALKNAVWLLLWGLMLSSFAWLSFVPRPLNRTWIPIKLKKGANRKPDQSEYTTGYMAYSFWCDIISLAIESALQRAMIANIEVVKSIFVIVSPFARFPFHWPLYLRCVFGMFWQPTNWATAFFFTSLGILPITLEW